MRSDAAIAGYLLATVFALAALSPQTAAATNACAAGLGPPVQILEPGDDDSGIGGTGFTPAPHHPSRAPGDDDDSGIGGTGRAPGGHDTRATRREPDDSGLGGTRHAPEESGIGGTGRSPDESGIGGTGLFGRAVPIERAKRDGGSDDTGRGDRASRVCVNGVEVTIPETLALESSGGADAASAARSVAAGQIVFVEATRTADGLVARRVVLAEDGAGRIDQVTADGTLVVTGRRLRLAPDARRAATLSRDGLEPGRWITFQSQVAPDGSHVVSRVAPGRPGVRRAPDTAFERELPERLRALERAGRVDYVSVEGHVARRGGGIRVGGVALTPGVLDTVRPGSRVRVGGRLDTQGRVRPEPLHRPAQPDITRPETRPRTNDRRDEAPPEPPPRPEPPTVDRPKVRDVKQPVPRPLVRPDVRPKAPRIDGVPR